MYLISILYYLLALLWLIIQDLFIKEPSSLDLTCLIVLIASYFLCQRVPASLQKLVIGSHVLRNPEQLADHCCPDLDLSVTFLLCSDEVRTALQGANPDCTLQALEAIKQLGPRAGERERCAIEGLLQDPRDRIRWRLTWCCVMDRQRAHRRARREARSIRKGKKR